MDDYGGNCEIQQCATLNPVSEKKIWNPKIFIIISVLFSFLPAAILYSLNYGRLGNVKKRNLYLIPSILLFFIVISLSMLIDNPLIKPLFFGLNIGLGAYM